MTIQITRGVVCHDWRAENSVVGSVYTYPFEDGVFLFRLWVGRRHRKKGIASELLKSVIDQSTGPVFLIPEPFGEIGLTRRELEKWYTREGFVWGKCGQVRMMRREKQNV